MITSIERIGTEENHDGWFRVNKHVDVQFLDGNDGGVEVNLRFDPDVLTEEDAYELAVEVLSETSKMFLKDDHDTK